MTQIIGVDEVGRGPLAGPVLAVAVILDPLKPISFLADSKKVSEKKRVLLSHEIRKKSLRWAFAIASVIEIDKYNILQASLLAMTRAVAFLRVRGDYHVMVDGNQCPKMALPVTAIIKGDSLIPEISAASIVAKVIRDNLMNVFAKKYPDYGLEQHKGYPTKIHLAALKKFGVTPLHRKGFAPVSALLES